jgi:hypothetical protein
MDDVFFTTFAHNSCNEICFSVMSVSTTLEWSGALFIQQLLGVGARHWFVYSSKLYASCGLCLHQFLWEGWRPLFLICKVNSATIETADRRTGLNWSTARKNIWNLYDIWTRKNVDFWKYTICLDMVDKLTYGEGGGHLCRAFHVR